MVNIVAANIPKAKGNSKTASIRTMLLSSATIRSFSLAFTIEDSELAMLRDNGKAKNAITGVSKASKLTKVW